MGLWRREGGSGKLTAEEQHGASGGEDGRLNVEEVLNGGEQLEVVSCVGREESGLRRRPPGCRMDSTLAV